jgi:predicted kinase
VLAEGAEQSGVLVAMQQLVIVVAGLPGSGKTTLARGLAHELHISLVSKDVIKEALFDVLGTGDLDHSQHLGRAAHAVMYALAADLDPVMLESHFWRGVAEPDLSALGRPLIQVHCRCPVEVAVERYRRRVADPTRHPGHLPEHQADAVIARWASSEPQPLDLPGALIEVDTTTAVDVVALASDVHEAYASMRDRL